jgi:flagellar motor protein MotB
MSKKKKTPPPPAQEGAPEWMVSYADMITIMMAFFVVMYAMAPKKDQEKKESPTQRLMQSIYTIRPNVRAHFTKAQQRTE